MPDAAGRIFVAEDDALVGFYLEDLLAELGLEVVGPAQTAWNAERLAATERLDFAWLDVNLEGGTSFKAAEILLGRGVPFAFLTAYGAAGVREDLRKVPILSKPVNIRDFKDVLRRHGLL